MKLIGRNANGLFQKLESIENVLCVETPSVVFLQETKMGTPHRIKTPSSKNYTLYELQRIVRAEKGENGGGFAIVVLSELEPSWISEGDDDTEVITVEIWLGGFPVRLQCGYGPQEYDPKKMIFFGFWEYLNKETQKHYLPVLDLFFRWIETFWQGQRSSNIIRRN